MPNNNDELVVTGLSFGGVGSPGVVGIGNFHKTLPHNRYGEVDPAAYAKFKLAATTAGDYDDVPRGYLGGVIPPFQAGFVVPSPPQQSDNFNNPQAARAGGKLGGAPGTFSMPPAPGVRSKSTAAEMCELQWMSILRDRPLINFTSDSQVNTCIADVRTQFAAALAAAEPGGLRLGVDLPRSAAGELDIRGETLFRCGLLNEDKGPLVSQFFLHDIAYGAQFIEQKVRPYKQGRDFLIDHGSWLRAQNAGLDEWGHGYSGDNDFISEPGLEEPGGPRRIATMRDIARFVNKDALHQAYFNAAILCLNWGVPFDEGNPYLSYSRQSAFGTFGGPDLLTRVSEVASRALEVVWRQKWEVHRRLRPEAYGGLMQMQAVGLEETPGVFTRRAYGLPDIAFQNEGAKHLRANAHKAYYLPIAFSAGSPPHPAYGAGHATVAGACVTVLKAWLAEKTPLNALFAAKAPHNPFGNASADLVAVSQTDATGQLVPYTGADADLITVEGELNKLACNVAMGRSMGGVHWRSDNTRSLRLGEQLAAEVLREESQEYAERKKVGGGPPVWSFTSFNGDDVMIFDGQVLVNSTPVDPKAAPL